MTVRAVIITILVAILQVTDFDALAQEGTKNEVETVIRNLFKAMEIGDSTLARSTFADEVTTATIAKSKDGLTKVFQKKSVDEFITAIGKPHEKIWYEEIWNLSIQVDGDFAQAWCDYAFYLDNDFSHCGVDAIQLYKRKDGWKIFHLADTRRKTDCDIPPDIKQRHKQ